MTTTLQILKSANSAWSEAIRARASAEIIEKLDQARRQAAEAHAMFLATILAQS